MKALHLTIIVITCAYLVAVFAGIGTYRQKFTVSKAEAIQTAIEKAAVQCYALEGQYPPDLEYLRDNYGIQIDYDNFIYDYVIFASNLRPIIKVIDKTRLR